MDIKQCVEEILKIGSLNGECVGIKENANMLKWIYSGSEKTIKSEKAELESCIKSRDLYKPCTREYEASLKASISDLERQLSALKLLEVKKRKELKEKIQITRNEYYKAFNYLNYCDKISKLEKSIAENEKKYAESVQHIENFNQKIRSLENEISTRVDAVLSVIEKSEKKIPEIAEAITCAPTLLPGKLLNVLITDASSPLLAGLPIDKQVKLLWNRNIPLSFGGMEWNVVEIERNRARLILRGTVYDGIGFSEAKKGGWDNSYGRKKLNGEFLNKFSDEEKSFIIPNEKIFGDKFFILSKEEIDQYLDYNQLNTPSQWWMRGSRLSTCSEDKERYVDFWDSYYRDEYRSSLGNGPVDIALSDAHYARDHIIGYRPLVLVRINDDPADAGWKDLWQSTAESSIICQGKWTSSNNYVQPYVRFSSADVARMMQNAGGSSVPTTNWRDDVNSNGTPSGHGGHIR
jgi:hypothetical protein